MENKVAKLLTTIAVILFSISIFGFIIGLILEATVGEDVAAIIYLGSAALCIVAIAITIIRFVKYGIPSASDVIVYMDEAPKYKEPKTVDVKEIKETPEQKLYKQYEGLYKEKLITKEELEAKRKELLGK